jgi:hypothetical protein
MEKSTQERVCDCNNERDGRVSDIHMVVHVYISYAQARKT